MKKLCTLLLVLLYLNIHGIYAQNAPISTIEEIATYNATITVPITVTDFNNIGSCNLRFLYDPTIAICTSVTKGPGVAGGIAVNLDTPGAITIGWYTWPGISLPDNSVIFNLNFSRVEYGFTAIEFDNDYPDRQWSSGDFVVLNDIPTANYYLDGSLFFLTQNAPATIAPDVVGVAGGIVEIPITVTDFYNIGIFNLKMEYDNLALTYQSFTNDSGFPGLTVDGTTDPGFITATGMVPSGNSGFSLNDNATFFTITFSYTGGASDLTWFDDGPSCQYEGYPDYNVLNDSPPEGFYLNGSVGEAIQLGITVFLEGAFSNGEMITTLKDLNLIPLTQPYSSSPWFYIGEESVSSVPENVVDWVLIELRETSGDASTPIADKIISQQAGFLLKDGSIKDLKGIDNLIFPVSTSGNLYIVIYHRNHINAISANPIPIFNGQGSYNFSSGESQVLGGSLGHKFLATGVWGLAAGDSNADGIIDDSDKNDYWKPNAGLSGYLSSDFSMDSENNNKDKNEFWNLNYDFTSQVPE